MGNVAKLVRDYSFFVDERDNFLILKHKAYEAFDPRTLTKELKSIRDTSWNSLRIWVENYMQHPAGLKIQDWDVIYNTFDMVANSVISRKQFAELLRPSCDGIDHYVKLLNQKISQTNLELTKQYFYFMTNNSGDFDFILREPHIRDIIFKFLLS